MSENISISREKFQGLQRIMNRMDIHFQRQDLNDLISEKEAAEFLEVSVNRLRNMVYDGTIPKDAYVVLVNSTRKFYKQKLIK